MLKLGNEERTVTLTDHQAHLLRTALAWAAQQMRRDMATARALPCSVAARQWSRTSLKFATLYELAEELDDAGDDDDEPSVMGAGARRPVGGGSDISDAPLTDAPDASSAPDAAAS